MDHLKFIKWEFYPFKKPFKNEIIEYINHKLNPTDLIKFYALVDDLTKEWLLSTSTEAVLFIGGAYYFTNNFKDTSQPFNKFEDVKNTYLNNLENNTKQHETREQIKNSDIKILENSDFYNDKILKEIEFIAFHHENIHAKLKALDMLAKIKGKYKEDNEQKLHDDYNLNIKFIDGSIKDE